jgi:hypothetical protein
VNTRGDMCGIEDWHVVSGFPTLLSCIQVCTQFRGSVHLDAKGG